MNEQVAVRDLFERRTKRRNQRFRQIANKSDRVVDYHFLFVWQAAAVATSDRASRTSFFSAYTSLCVNALSSVDFPAFVYPTSEIIGRCF